MTSYQEVNSSIVESHGSVVRVPAETETIFILSLRMNPFPSKKCFQKISFPSDKYRTSSDVYTCTKREVNDLTVIGIPKACFNYFLHDLFHGKAIQDLQCMSKVVVILFVLYS